MYSNFKTNPDLERKGVLVDYGNFRVCLARAGGANKRYQKLLERLTRPHQKAIQIGSFDNEHSLELLRQVYAETVVTGWEVKVDGVFQPGIEAEDGSILPFNVENLLMTLKKLPDLFADLMEHAGHANLYREALMEEAAGN